MAADRKAQVGLLVALPEELAQIQRQLQRLDAGSLVRGRSGSDYDLYRHPVHQDLTIACGTSSGIGLLNASLAASRMINDVNPGLVVMTGIAGSLSDDAHIGDTVIATSVVHYLAEAKAIDTNRKSFALRLDGHEMRLDHRLNDSVRKFIDQLYSEHPAWRDLLGKFADHSYINSTILSQRRQAADAPRVLSGKVASGDVACGSVAFQQLLLSRDRKLLAIDMESAGVAATADSRNTPWFFVRGISDYSDGKKSDLDRNSLMESDRVGPWRRHAAELAGRILVELLPYLAHSLELGSADGISARNRTLHLPAGGVDLSPSVLERRRVGSFQDSRTESLPGEIIDTFDDFCKTHLDPFRPGRVYASNAEGLWYRLTQVDPEKIQIDVCDPDGKEIRPFGQVHRAQGEASAVAWEPTVDHEAEETLQTKIKHISVWLERVPQERTDTDDLQTFASVDNEGNVTVGHNLYIRRYSRTVRTGVWSDESKVADLRITLMQMLGVSTAEAAGVIRAVRRSITSQKLLGRVNPNNIGETES